MKKIWIKFNQFLERLHKMWISTIDKAYEPVDFKTLTIEEEPIDDIVLQEKPIIEEEKPQPIMKEYKEVFKQSPNVSARSIKPEGVVLHHTGGGYSGSVNWCLNPKSQVSYHVIVDTNGDRTRLAKSTQRAWHAGVSSFNGRKDCNSFLLGFSVAGNTYQRELTQDEIDSLASLCILEMKQWGFGIEMITTHGEIAPTRKNDVAPRAKKAVIDRIKELL